MKIDSINRGEYQNSEDGYEPGISISVVFTDADFKENINKSHFAEMSQQDEENLIAEYFANFFINSWMNQLN
jgi:hypothetical protein